MDYYITIITRDINGKRITHALSWDGMYNFVVNKKEDLEEQEILMFFANGACLYSSLTSDKVITWDDVIGFLA